MSLAVQEQRWRSGQFVGNAKPVLKGYVRRGRLRRHYENLPPDEVFSYVPGLKGPNAVWFARWEPEESYVEIPNILEVSGDQDFSQNGVEQITMAIDNVELAEESGVAGIFHTISRGFMAPLRGFSGYNNYSIGEANEWQDTWKDQATQIMLVAGYGEAFFPVFCGLVDDVDLVSRPDRITVTARNIGKALTDQRCFMDAKHLWIRDPITFCDRQLADELQDVARAAEAKSTNGTHLPRFVLDNDEETVWLSEKHGNENELEWIEVRVPHGRFEDLQLFPAVAGMEMYVSVHATNTEIPKGGEARKTDGTIVGEGWISEGLGNVPGTTIPYTKFVGQVKEKAAKYGIREGGGGYYIGDDSRVRLWFRKLAKTRGQKAWVYQAGVRTLKVYDRTKFDSALENHWILVDDVSDIVKTVLQWAGIHDWEIESVGQRLADKMVFDRQTFLIDIIRHIAEMTSYVFYVKPPETFDAGNLAKGNEANLSPGIAIFRQNNAMKEQPQDRRYMIRDSELLTGIQAKFSNEPLADSIRVRGRTVAKEKARKNPGNIHPLGEDRTSRFQYSYRPVWARDDQGGAGGIRKSVVHYDENINNLYLAKVGCLLIAFRQALEAGKAQVEFPFFPAIHLDHQIALIDEGTGLATRLWVATRSWRYRSGEQTEFSMALGGSLIDTDDVKNTRQELVQLLNYRGFDPAPIARGPWTEPHFF